MNTLDIILGLNGQDRPARMSTKQAWMFVGAAFQQPSPHCEECSYCEHKGQMVGFDEGRAHEVWQECGLSPSRGDQPEQCPAYASYLAEMTEDEQ